MNDLTDQERAKLLRMARELDAATGRTDSLHSILGVVVHKLVDAQPPSVNFDAIANKPFVKEYFGLESS